MSGWTPLHRNAQSRHQPPAVSRRRLLQLTGFAAFLGACADPETNLPKVVAPQATTPQPTSITTAPRPASPSNLGTPTTSADMVPSSLEICRDAWGARPPRPGGRPHNITRMTIHHTAVVLGDNRNIISRLQQHQRFHQDEKGWVDIAYHIGVDRNGNIFELRTPAIAGDTATNYDTTGHFLVVCEGNFDEEPISEAQLNGAARVFAWATQEFGITANTLASHQQVTPTTACPGSNLQAHVASGDLERRINDLLVAGPVQIRPICGQQAFQQVAAIEAGMR